MQGDDISSSGREMVMHGKTAMRLIQHVVARGKRHVPFSSASFTRRSTAGKNWFQGSLRAPGRHMLGLSRIASSTTPYSFSRRMTWLYTCSLQ